VTSTRRSASRESPSGSRSFTRNKAGCRPFRRCLEATPEGPLLAAK
jgi:hypothetical protein